MITVLINPGSGTARQQNAVADLRRLLAEQLPQARVELVAHGADLADRARAAVAAGAEVVAAAGGDGTLCAVAQALIGTTVRLGVLPFGTRNHFARDVGVPIDLQQAVALLGSGAARPVDVGCVNERFFLNNASIGLYPQLVDLRDAQADSLSKSLRMLLAAMRLARQAQPIPLELRYADQQVRALVWLVFVGNNSYQLGVFGPVHRATLDAGQLDIVVVPARGRWRITSLALRRSPLSQKHVLRAEAAAATAQPLSMTTCEVAYDGETAAMRPPLIFRSVPRALWVVAPR